jgi:hypothetical protein
VTPEVAADGVERGVYTYANAHQTALAAGHARVVVEAGGMLNGMEFPTAERHVCVRANVV